MERVSERPPSSFVMNWEFTRANAATFTKRELSGLIHLGPNIALAELRPMIRPLDEVRAEYMTWNSEGRPFNAGLEMRGELSEDQKWQKSYLVGMPPSDMSKADESLRVKRPLMAPIYGALPERPGTAQRTHKE